MHPSGTRAGLGECAVADRGFHRLEFGQFLRIESERRKDQCKRDQRQARHGNLLEVRQVCELPNLHYLPMENENAMRNREFPFRVSPMRA